MTAGKRGPALLQDVWFLEKLAHFDREVTPPNSYVEWQEQPDFTEPPLDLEGAAGRWNHREDDDYFSQPGKLFRLMTADTQQLLFANTARAIGGAPKEIQLRHIGDCLKADP
jgi:catalase